MRQLAVLAEVEESALKRVQGNCSRCNVSLAYTTCIAYCLFKSYHSRADNDSDHDLTVDAELIMLHWQHADHECRVYAECLSSMSKGVKEPLHGNWASVLAPEAFTA